MSKKAWISLPQKICWLCFTKDYSGNSGAVHSEVIALALIKERETGQVAAQRSDTLVNGWMWKN